jgi:2-methylcitrate dehydratase PrpD
MERQTLTSRLGAFVTGLDYSSLTTDVVAKAKTCILDGIANAFGGHDWPWTKVARKTAASIGGKGDASVWGSDLALTVPEAAFANTVAAHSVLHEDMHMEAQSHFGTMIVPVAFAQGEAQHASGRDVLTAVVAGYEIGGRVGKMLVGEDFIRRNFRPSGTFGPLAAAATAGRLMGLPAAQMTEALGMAANLGAGLNEFAKAGTMDLYFHNAFAARNGLVSALLARNGVRTAPEIIEGVAGMATAFHGGPLDVARTLDGLGERWEIFNVYAKPAPACAYLQSVMQAAQKIFRKGGYTPDAIEEVTVRTFLLGKVCPGTDYAGPFHDIMNAQMSNQFCIAAILLDGELTLDHLVNRHSEAIGKLAKRIQVEIDDAAMKVFPARKMGTVRVRLTNGTVLEQRVDDLEMPTDEDVEQKFVAYGRRVLPADRVDRLLQMIRTLEQAKDISKLGALLRSEVKEKALA